MKRTVDIFTCDICTYELELAAERELPPVGWAVVTVLKDPKNLQSDTLARHVCPGCYKTIVQQCH